MLGVWEATAVALIEGTARIYEQTGELPRNEPELLMALGSVGIPLKSYKLSGVYRVEAAWLCSYLTPSGKQPQRVSDTQRKQPMFKFDP